MTPGRRAAVVLFALILDGSLLQRASAAQVCAWIVESVEDDGDHKFELNVGADATTSVAVRFQGSNFTSASMGGDMIQLDPTEPRVVDGESFDVSPGQDLSFDVRLYDRPMASLEEMDNPTGKLLAAFTFHRTVGEDERSPPADLATKQCVAL